VLVAGAVFSFTSATLADTQHIDGDIGNNTPNLMYGSGHDDCTTLGDPVSAALKLHFDGNPNDPTAHFDAGTAVSLSFADRDTGNGNHGALAAGIEASQSGSATIPSPWNQSSSDAQIPFSVTVPSTVADGTYQLEVAASGTDGNGNSYSPPGGRPLFIIHVGCGSGGGGDSNQPPTVSAISGDASAYEGDTKTYSITESDLDGDTLANSWSITSGNAEIVGANDGTSVSVHFTDGPSSVDLQAEVNDSNGHIVTKTLSISEANVAPSVTFTSGDPSVNENVTTTHTYSYSISDPGDDTVNSVTADCGSLGGTPGSPTHTNTDGSFTCVFDDGHIPPTASTVEAKATDSDLDTGSYGTYSVTVNNVAPTVGAISGPTSVLTGPSYSYTYSASATDPSGADTTAKFNWAWDTGNGFGAYSSAASNPGTSPAVSFSSCGSATIQAKAKDKDGGESAASSSLTVAAYDGQFNPPLTAGIYNAVQKGQVVPVKISIGCGGTFLSGLHPAINLKSGDADPSTDLSDPTVNVATSVSAADTAGVMREVDGQYIYNLAVPSNATAGSLFTIYVRPFGGTTPVMMVVLKIRK
jgi:hypothetical protein